MNIENTLSERQHTHGDFKTNANASQGLKACVTLHTTQELSAVQLEALDNICQKIARIITGNPNWHDNWVDVSGYATLAARECQNDNS